MNDLVVPRIEKAGRAAVWKHEPRGECGRVVASMTILNGHRGVPAGRVGIEMKIERSTASGWYDQAQGYMADDLVSRGDEGRENLRKVQWSR